MRGRFLCFLVGHPGIRRTITMSIMLRTRRTLKSSELDPDSMFIRTIQSPSHIVKDQLTGRYVISSKAFDCSSSDKSLSGDLNQLLQRDGISYSDFKSPLKRVVAAYAIKIQQLRANGLEVLHQPIATNWYHGGAIGKFTKGVKRKLKEQCAPLIEIDQDEARRLDAMQAPLLNTGEQ